MHAHFAAVFAQQPRQLKHLFPRALAGIREGMIVHAAELNAALGNHKTRHRAVNAAGEQQTRLAVRAHRHALNGGDALDGQIRMVADLDHHRVIGMVDVHAQVRHMFEDVAARLAHDRRGIERIALVGAARQHLERAGKRLHHFSRLLADRPEIVLVHLNGRADGMNAEHARHTADALVHIRKIGYVEAPFAHPDAAVHRAHGLTDVIHQLFHKERAVLPLQKHLAEANQQDFSHRFISF